MKGRKEKNKTKMNQDKELKITHSFPIIKFITVIK